MAAKYRELIRKKMFVALCLLIVPPLFTIIFTVNCSKKPEPVVASENKEQEADANKAPAEPNQQPKDPNDVKNRGTLA